MADSQPEIMGGGAVRFQRLPMQTTGPVWTRPQDPLRALIYMILKLIFQSGLGWVSSVNISYTSVCFTSRWAERSVEV